MTLEEYNSIGSFIAETGDNYPAKSVNVDFEVDLMPATDITYESLKKDIDKYTISQIEAIITKDSNVVMLYVDLRKVKTSEELSEWMKSINN